MHYFAYSSNMNLDHMRRLCGWHFNVLGVAALGGYEFGPDTRGYANVRPKEGGKVFGVLYTLDQHALDALDHYEGYPDVFGRHQLAVEDVAGKKHEAWVYLQKPELFGGEIKEEFLKRVLIGAEENHLPQKWVEFLQGFRRLANG